VAVTPDGAAALEVAGWFRPDIALVDIGLPQMDGYELARRLRQVSGMEKVPLVAISGYGRKEDHGSRSGVYSSFGEAGRASSPQEIA
jgi:CheY-like chemotaxis protein